MNLKRRIANSGGCFSMFSLAVWICIWFTNLSIFDLRSREDNRCWDSLFLVHDLFYSCWVNGHNPHHGILRSTGTTPSENEDKKQNKKKEEWKRKWKMRKGVDPDWTPPRSDMANFKTMVCRFSLNICNSVKENSFFIFL